MKVLFLSLGAGNLLGRDIGEEDRSQLIEKMITEEKYAYREANYRLGDKIYKSPFVAEALIDQFKPGQIMLVGTVKSAWSSFYAKYADNESKQDDLVTLYAQEQDNGLVESSDIGYLKSCEERVTNIIKRIKAINGKDIVIDVSLLMYGLNDKELKFNFDVLADKWKRIITESSEESISIAFDISHSFRSLPVFNMAIINYLVSLTSKMVSLDHVYYGNLDASYENNGIAEVVDLKDVTDLMRMTNGVAEFNNSGNTSLIINEIKQVNPEIAKGLEKFDWAIQANRLVLLTESIKDLRSLLKSNNVFGKNTILYDMMLENINSDFPTDEEISEFNDIENHYTAYGHLQRVVGLWHLKHGRYGQAIVSGQEALASYMIPFYLSTQGKTVTLKNCTEFAYRQRAISKTITRKAQFFESNRNIYPDLVDCLLRLSDIHKEVADDRNVFAHIVWDVKENAGFNIKAIKKAVDELYKNLYVLEHLTNKDLERANQLIKEIILAGKTGGKRNMNEDTNPKKQPTKKLKLKSTEIHFFTAETLSKGRKLMFGRLENGKEVCMVVKKGTQVNQIIPGLRVLIAGKGPQGIALVEKLN